VQTEVLTKKKGSCWGAPFTLGALAIFHTSLYGQSAPAGNIKEGDFFMFDGILPSYSWKTMNERQTHKKCAKA
jgi:hypothetical protein